MSDVLTDALVGVGAAIVTVGLYLVDWRLAVAWFGALVMAAGIARLPRRR